MIDFLLKFYKRIISPITHFIGMTIFGPHFACRFTPTCSEYARQAFRRYGIIYGLKLSLIRFSRCHPFSRGGFDPLPEPDQIS